MLVFQRPQASVLLGHKFVKGMTKPKAVKEAYDKYSRAKHEDKSSDEEDEDPW